MTDEPSPPRTSPDGLWRWLLGGLAGGAARPRPADRRVRDRLPPRRAPHDRRQRTTPRAPARDNDHVQAGNAATGPGHPGPRRPRQGPLRERRLLRLPLAERRSRSRAEHERRRTRQQRIGAS